MVDKILKKGRGINNWIVETRSLGWLILLYLLFTTLFIEILIYK